MSAQLPLDDRSAKKHLYRVANDGVEKAQVASATSYVEDTDEDDIPRVSYPSLTVPHFLNHSMTSSESESSINNAFIEGDDDDCGPRQAPPVVTQTQATQSFATRQPLGRATVMLPARVASGTDRPAMVNNSKTPKNKENIVSASKPEKHRKAVNKPVKQQVTSSATALQLQRSGSNATKPPFKSTKSHPESAIIPPDFSSSNKIKFASTKSKVDTFMPSADYTDDDEEDLMMLQCQLIQADCVLAGMRSRRANMERKAQQDLVMLSSMIEEKKKEATELENEVFQDQMEKEAANAVNQIDEALQQVIMSLGESNAVYARMLTSVERRQNTLTLQKIYLSDDSTEQMNEVLDDVLTCVGKGLSTVRKDSSAIANAAEQLKKLELATTETVCKIDRLIAEEACVKDLKLHAKTLALNIEHLQILIN